MIRVLLYAALACAVHTGAAQAAGAAPVQAAPSPVFGLIQVLLYLGLVLGLFAAFAWAMKRYGPRGAARAQNVKLVGSLAIGGRERILVVEVADQWIVVGAAPGRVSALSTLPRPPHAETADPAAPGAQPAAGKNFADWLKHTLDKRNGNDT